MIFRISPGLTLHILWINEVWKEQTCAKACGWCEGSEGLLTLEAAKSHVELIPETGYF